jgi:hypothetical protein
LLRQGKKVATLKEVAQHVLRLNSFGLLLKRVRGVGVWHPLLNTWGRGRGGAFLSGMRLRLVTCRFVSLEGVCACVR